MSILWMRVKVEKQEHGRASEHGVTVSKCCPCFLTVLLICIFSCFGFWDVFGWVLGHLTALTLIPNDV